MKNRVHYGEFTLDYWVEQLISEGIVLPEYQRSFVWNKEQIKNLINSIGKDEFVPPITIGKLNDKNIIIDGQQRLTSIVLAYLNILPSERRYKKTIKVEGDNEDDEDDEIEEEHYFEWTINTLKELGSNVSEIRSALRNSDDYETLGTHWVNDEFLKKHYLGFSYIIPHTDITEDDQHRFFSTIFRNVNIGGTNLLKTESRKSLYYLNNSYVPLFAPEFAKNIFVKQFGADSQPIDFLRLLALVFDYSKNDDSSKVMKGYKTKSEVYYEIFISDTVNPDSASGIFKKINDVMPIAEIEAKMNGLKEEWSKLSMPHELSSIIDVDIYMLGLIYWVLIKMRRLDNAKLDDLKEKLNDKIKTFRDNPSHAKSPASLKYLRERIAASINVFKDYLI